MNAKIHAEPVRAGAPVYVPAWLALAVAVVALVVGIVSLQSSTGSTEREAAIGTNPWVGVDMAALQESGYTGRLGAAAAEDLGQMSREELVASGFTGRLGS